MTSVRWWWSSSLSQLYPEYFWLKYFLIWIWFETVSDYEEGFLKSLLQQKLSNKHWFSSGQGNLKFLQSSKKEFWRLDSNNCRAPTSNKLLPHWIIIKRNKKSWLSILRHVRLKGVRMRLSDWSMPHIGGLLLAESCVWEGCCEGTGQWWVIMNLNRLLAPTIIIILKIIFKQLTSAGASINRGRNLGDEGWELDSFLARKDLKMAIDMC